MNDKSSNNVDISKMHVIFLHNKFRKRPEDRYFVDLAVAVKDSGHKVTIFTSDLDQKYCYEEVNSLTGSLNVHYSGWWLPRSMKMFKAVIMALRMVFFPPSPKPEIIFLDVHTIALYIFSIFSNYKTFYVTNFQALNQVDFFTKYMKITPTFMNAKGFKHASEIVVQSDGLGDVFRRSYPRIKKELIVLYPCLDTGLWKERAVDISRIIPDIPKPNFLFVCFGAYRKRSNFKLILEAFEELLSISSSNIRNSVHLAIAGNGSDADNKIYYNELLNYTKDKTFASQVTFLKQLPTIHKKTLIEESIGVLLPCKYDIFPDTILSVLSSGRPIISTNTGFAKEALRHRITAILVEPSSQMFASAMFKILTSPAIQVFLSDMGHDVFLKNYSFNVFKRKINCLIMNYVEFPKKEI